MKSKKLLAGLGVLALVAAYFVTREPREAAAPAAVSEAPSGTAPLADPQMGKSESRIGGGPARSAASSDLDVRPLFDRTTRLAAGKPTKFRFTAHSRATGSPASSADISVSVLRPGRSEQRLAAQEVEEGIYEASFTPGAPGRYRIVVNAGGVPISSVPEVKLGVVGAAGTDGTEWTDITNSTTYDPRTSRTKGTGRGHRR